MSKRTQTILIVVGLLAYLLWQAQSPVVPADVPIRVTYVYEHRDGSPPPEVLGAIGKLNRDTTRKIIATTFEDDTTDGTDDTPEQYKLAASAAKEHGTPCLVVEAGGRVLKVVKSPTTEQQILEALP